MTPETAVGMVRSVILGTTVKGDAYARIRLARDTGYFMDFDDPDAWPDLKGSSVCIWFTEQMGDDGRMWRVALDVEHDDDWNGS